MKKTLLITSYLLSSLTFTVFSQTTLNLGDIAFTGMNRDGSDDFSFVLLKDITTNTTITFTDNGWLAIGGFRGNETEIVWTAGDNLTCGTQVTITETTSINNGGYVVGTVTGSKLLFPTGGDQIFAYQGTTPTAGDETSFITAIQSNGPWDADATSSNTSAKPSVFTDGINSISFAAEIDNAAYSNCGIAAGDATVIYNTANWSQDNTTPYVLPLCTSFSCSAVCTDPTIPTVTYAPTAVCSDSATTLTITGTLNDATEWIIYTGSCGGTLIGGITATTFVVNPSITTTYYIRGEGGCATPGACTSVTVVVTPTDDANFTYDNSFYCHNGTNPTPTITGLTGGTFTASPTGLAINASTGEIDLANSTPNIYGVTYTTSGPCINSSIQYLTVGGPKIGYEVIAVCDSYTWIDGITYTSSNYTATYLLTSSLGCDSIATLNLTIKPSNTSTDNQTACDSYTWIDGTTYTASNTTATHTLTNTTGCDSVVTLNLTINTSTTGIDTQTACNAYTWIDGLTYTASNTTATHTLATAEGCDSIVTLNLSIVNTLTTTDTQVACDSYTWSDGITYTASNTSAVQHLTSVEGCDSIVTLNLTINTSTTGVDAQAACDSYTWIDGTTYTASNTTATHTLTNAAGCDSVVTLNLTLTTSDHVTDVITACDSYVWIDGVTYTNSNNTATHLLANGNGCDSIVTLDLTIHSPSTGIDTQQACSDYVWIDGITYTTSNSTATHTLPNAAGCDSIVTLNLTLNSPSTFNQTATICSGETFLVGTTNYNTSGTFTTVLVAANGCDSIVTTNLTVNNELDTYVKRLNAVFKVNTTPGATYQWLNCENGNAPIPGATSTSYTASAVGSYAVVVTVGSCSDTSICNELPYIVGIESNEKRIISVYPNPATASVTVELNKNYSNATLTLLDVTGKLVYSQLIRDEVKINITTEQLEKGIYFIRLQTEDHSETIQLIKQ